MFATEAHFTLAAVPLLRAKGDFMSMFGTTPAVCASTWNLLDLPPDAEPKHLLWALFFVKQHPKWAVIGKVTGASKPTFKKWAWFFIIKVHDLHPHLVGNFACCCCN